MNKPRFVPIYSDPMPMPRTLIGREKELDKVLSLLLLDSTRIIAIEGGIGLGKSALAGQVFKEFSERKCFIRIDPSKPFRKVATQIISEFALTDVNFNNETPTYLLDYVLHLLTTQKHLLVLDGIEAILDSNRNWCHKEYQSLFTKFNQLKNPKSCLVLTSRELPVESKNWVGFHQINIAGIDSNSSIQILKDLEVEVSDLETLRGMAILKNPLFIHAISQWVRCNWRRGERNSTHIIQISPQLLFDIEFRHNFTTITLGELLSQSYARLSDDSRNLLLEISRSDSSDLLVPEFNNFSRELIEKSWLEEIGDRRLRLRPELRLWLTSNSQVAAIERATNVH